MFQWPKMIYPTNMTNLRAMTKNKEEDSDVADDDPEESD